MVDSMPAIRNLDIDLLRSFATIAETANISRAAERLLRNQSTVSLQLKRLEDAVGRRLFERTSHKVRLTQHGEALLGYARRILALNDEIVARVNEPQLEGNVRLGVPEDFATTYMPVILGEFAKSYPQVSLEVTCDLTLKLLESFRAGAFDLLLVKREPAARGRGVRVWREPLVWVCGAGYTATKHDPLALVVSPEPCVYRKRAIQALRRAGRGWRLAYTCGSLAGAQAAVKAGLGVTVLPKDMVPAGLHILDSGALPDLHDTEIALIGKDPLSKPGQRLREHIVSSLEQPRR
jgi:DNA-binding transcriptional LysR family regulator